MITEPRDQLFALLRQQGEAGYIGESVSQLAHALQSASLAQQESASEHLVLAALLHDIGHICDPRAEQMPGVGVLRHEYVGAEFLRSLGMAEEVAELVEQHVNAKRYLTFRYPAYADKLSNASRQTLRYQGGPMNEDEARRFEQHPRFHDILKLRAWDEAAKRTDVEEPTLDYFRAMIRRNCGAPLTATQLGYWQDRGYIKLSGWFGESEIEELRQAADRLQALPDTPGKWMKYYEAGAGGRQLCRIENFVQYDRVMERVAVGESTLGLVGELMAAPAVLFKEKINFKLPGGNGFIEHQDAPAFTSFGHDYHITMMVSIDASTVENGCLEVAPGAHRDGLLPVDPDLTIATRLRDGFEWLPVPTEPGDLLLFGSHLPHRSGPNRSNRSRRALYATYNRRSEGDVREDYFRMKREAFPPDVEKVPGKQYDAGVFNVGNPVSEN